jgi:hypothetical protein
MTLTEIKNVFYDQQNPPDTNTLQRLSIELSIKQIEALNEINEREKQRDRKAANDKKHRAIVGRGKDRRRF